MADIIAEMENQFLNLTKNIVDIKEFETWVYETIELKNILSNEDYLKLLSIDYRKMEISKYEVFLIFKKYIGIDKLVDKTIISELCKSMKEYKLKSNIMDFEKQKITDEEYCVLERAVGDINKYGNSTAVCPRCNKKLVYEEQGNSYGIKCEDEKCIGLICRGL